MCSSFFFKPDCDTLRKEYDVPDSQFLCSSAIVTAYENSSHHDPSSNNAMLGVHASASAIIQYGKIARKQGLVNVALDILSRIHTIPTVPIVDCFQKIRQQVKCYLQLAGVMGKNECMQVGSWRGGRAGAPGPGREEGRGECPQHSLAVGNSSSRRRKERKPFSVKTASVSLFCRVLSYVFEEEKPL